MAAPCPRRPRPPPPLAAPLAGGARSGPGATAARRRTHARAADSKAQAEAFDVREIPVERRRKTTAEECPFCADAPVKEDGGKCLGVCRLPQNVANPPLIFPHELQTCEDAVRLQLNALRDINSPRPEHGIQVLYEFAVEAGEMMMSRYFGFSSDLLHYDHFCGKALNQLDGLVSLQDYNFVEQFEREDGRTQVHVRVTDRYGKERFFLFIMVIRTFGKWKDCFNTHRLIETDSEFQSKWLALI